MACGSASPLPFFLPPRFVSPRAPVKMNHGAHDRALPSCTQIIIEHVKPMRIHNSQRLHQGILGFLLLAGALARASLLPLVKYPGWGDYSFYYTVARNLVLGRGFVIDYIWHFLYLPPQVTHYSNDYWMPLTSVLLAVPMTVLGPSVRSAAVASLCVGTLLALLAYVAARRHVGSTFTGLSAAAYTLVLSPLFTYSLITDTPVFYALFAGFALLALMEGERSPAAARGRWLVLAGLFAGLTHLTRQDGALLLLLLLFAAWWGERGGRIKRLVQALLPYGLVLTPWMALNVHYLGRPLTTGAFRTLFFRSYADMYAYKRAISPAYYFSWGWKNILRSKVHALLFNAHTFYGYLPLFMWAFAFVAVLLVIRAVHRREGEIPWRAFWWPTAHLVLLYLFYSLLFTFPGIQGGFLRSSMFYLPFLMVIVADVIRRHLGPRWVRLSWVGITVLLLAYQGWGAARTTVLSNARAGEGIARIVPVLRSDARPGEDIVLMTIAPWEFHAVTGFKTLQIPTDDREAIYELALRYRATHLVLPGKRDRFEALYRGEEEDPRFPLVARVPNSPMKLYRIRPPRPCPKRR